MMAYIWQCWRSGKATTRRKNSYKPVSIEIGPVHIKSGRIETAIFVALQGILSVVC